MGDDDSAAIANLRARVANIERDVYDIKTEQSVFRNRSEESRLRERDLTAQIELLSLNISKHLELHEGDSMRKIRAIDILLALGMLITSAISAYGAVAMMAVSKAVGK